MNRGKGKPAHKGYIYFMRRADGVGPIKIGCSRWPKERLSALTIWSPEPLEIVATVEGTFSDEKRLHNQFAAHRLHGEWFEAAGPVLAAMSRAATLGELPPAPANDRIVILTARYNAGDTLEAIAADFGVSRQRVEQLVRKAGLPPRGHRSIKRAPVWHNLERVRALADAGRSYGEIAVEIGDTYPNVINACRAEGIKAKRRKRIEPATIETAYKIAAAYKAGERTASIAKRFGIQQPSIYRFLEIAGVNALRRTRADQSAEWPELIARYKAGASIQEIAGLAGRATATVTRHFAKAGVLRSAQESEALRIERVRAANHARRAA